MRLRSLAPAVVAMLLSPDAAAAQEEAPDYQISQRGSITQMLGKTKVELDYSRPLGRGRAVDHIFGKVVHWGELWTPGANMATTLTISQDVKLNGHDVQAGKWSMWVIPSRVGPWELVLDARDSLFHTERPELTDEQIRFVIDVREDAAHTEALVWAFPRIAQDGATLIMNWLNFEIPLELEVESIEPPTTVAAAEAQRYLGVWRITFTPNDEGQGPPPTSWTVTYGDDGRLRATFPPRASPHADEPEPDFSGMTPQEREREEAKRTLARMGNEQFTYLLVPRAEGVYVMGYEEHGVLLEVEQIYHEFEFENGRAVKVTVRNNEDRIMGTAIREQ